MIGKYSSSKNKKNYGFTLIELLAVITIIGILSSLAFVGTNAAIKKTRRTQAAALIGQLSTAISVYNTEYGTWPVPSGSESSDYSYDSTTKWEELCKMLAGNRSLVDGSDSETDIPNSHGIVFMEFNQKNLIKGKNYIVDPTMRNVSEDKPIFYLIVDGDYDHSIDIPNVPEVTPSISRTINADMALWSLGGGTINSPKQAITSW